MKRKTVAIIGESYGATGKGLYPVELFKALNGISKEFDIKLFIRDTAKYNSNNVIKIQTLKTKRRVLVGTGYYIPLLLKLLKEESIDIIHAYDEKTCVLASLLRKPLVVTVYDTYPLDFYKFPFNYLFSILYRFLDRAKIIISISHKTSKRLCKRYPFFSKKIKTIYLGVDQKRFKPGKRKNNDCINIGLLGGLNDKIWNVLNKILEEYRGKIKINIAGKYIPKKFNNFRFNPKIVFHGFVKESDLPKYYQKMDIFVYYSEVEGFGLIPLEAMASGCAVISSNVDSLPEVVGNAGLLVKNTEEDFYIAVKRLIEDRKLRTKYQKDGIKRAKEFSWEKCAEKHLEVYKKLCK